MILSTTEEIAGKKIKETIGLVRGNTVQTRHVGKDIFAGLKTIVGGEIKGYTEMVMGARNQATQRMIDMAQEKGANAIVGVRYTTAEVMQGAAEVLAYGTAVKI